MSVRIVTKSATQTEVVAKDFAKKISALKKSSRAIVIALSGELGAGKTRFVRGFSRGLGIRARITSPTFLIMRSLKGAGRTVWHLDCYRVGTKALRALGFDLILSDSKNIVLVEWADRVKRILPKNTISVKFRHGKKENERIIEFKKNI